MSYYKRHSLLNRPPLLFRIKQILDESEESYKFSQCQHYVVFDGWTFNLEIFEELDYSNFDYKEFDECLQHLRECIKEQSLEHKLELLEL
jgi:hypothetical protein